MRSSRYLAFILLALISIFALATSSLAISSIASPPVGAESLNMQMKDARGYLDQLIESASQLNDYTFDSELLTYKSAKPSQSKGKMFYKKHDLVRVEVTDNSYKAGSVVVRRKDGVVRAQGGINLLYMKMTLQEDSRMLRLPNGYQVLRSDIHSLLSDVKRELAEKQFSVRVTTTTTQVAGQKAFVVEEVGPQDTLAKRIYVSADYNVPILWEIYQQGKLFSSVKFQHFQPNVGLQDELFNL